MKRLSISLAVALFLAAMSFGADTCVILKRSSGAVHAVQGIEFYYVEGTYPPAFKFMTNLRGRHVRKLVKMGGRMAIVEPNYTAADLEAARKQCTGTPAQPDSAPIK
jgi:hypothetical protein